MSSEHRGSRSAPADYELAEIAFEDAFAHRYNRDYHEPPILKRHHEDFAAFVATRCRAGDRLLDLGCGPASMWAHWRTHLPAPDSLIGVDISPGVIDEARRLEPLGDFRLGSLRNLPLESSSVDVVIASSVMHHVPDAALPESLTEITRVLTEHGVLVGREPAGVGRIADQAGWLSGAIMAFRHLAYRLTATREYGEPEIGDYHHAYDPKVFLELVARVLTPTHFESRHPFSFYVGRSSHPLVERLARFFDEWIGNHGGHEFYYVAEKNYHDAGDVADFIRRELEVEPGFNREAFMSLLQEAARRLEQELGPGSQRLKR
jgi:SAM-dependent methyltransferase